MELTCPHIIWKIFPFDKTMQYFSKPFKFFKCHWRWEYSVHPDVNNEVHGDIVSIHLRPLTLSSTCSLTNFCITASIKASDGYHAVRISNHKVSSLVVEWCVWQIPKTYFLENNLVSNNSCAFSLSIEPLTSPEYLNTLTNDESYSILCSEELSRDFDKIFRSSRYADIILLCNNTEIKAHKDVLCSRSKKFADMIESEGTLGNQSTSNLKTLILPPMDPAVFVTLLKYIYTATLPVLTSELARKMYESADEYCITSLKKRCSEFLIEHLSNSDATEILLFANENNDDKLKCIVSSYIAWDVNILNSDKWKKFAKHNHKLAVDVFKIFTERMCNRVSF